MIPTATSCRAVKKAMGTGNAQFSGRFISKVWRGLTEFYATYVWTDGTNIYYSGYGDGDQYVLNGDTWEPKVWNGLPDSPFYGKYIWTDGTNIYHSFSSYQYVLNGDTWEAKTWGGVKSPEARWIWTDGTRIYYTSGSAQFEFIAGSFFDKTWDNYVQPEGMNVWTDGTNIYCSFDGVQHILNGNAWVATDFEG